jgi:hypothetical protein
VINSLSTSTPSQSNMTRSNAIDEMLHHIRGPEAAGIDLGWHLQWVAEQLRRDLGRSTLRCENAPEGEDQIKCGSERKI